MIGRRVLLGLAMVIWIGAVVYPDPRPFLTSLARLRNPPVEASAAKDLAASIPADYRVVESFVREYVAYTPAWTTYGLPWYFPTVSEVIRDRAGDCQARALLEASILQAKGMPYTLRYSFDHVWVDYPGKVYEDLEDPATSFVADSGEGWLAGVPDKIPLWSIIEVRLDYHWTPMPVLQKILLLAGLFVILGYGERSLWRRLMLRKTEVYEPPLSTKPLG